MGNNGKLRGNIARVAVRSLIGDVLDIGHRDRPNPFCIRDTTRHAFCRYLAARTWSPSSRYNPCTMTARNGAFALHTVEDLLKKLKYDMQRLEANPADSYAAFDFFITAFHMKDWANKSGLRIKPKHSSEKVLMDVCRHLANGSKHFDMESSGVIEGTEHVEGAFDSSFRDNAFQVERLVVHLKGQAAKQLGDSVEATALARKAIYYWERKL